MRLLDHIDAFLTYLRVERGASVHTIDAYRSDLAGFAAFLAGLMASEGQAAATGVSAPQWWQIRHRRPACRVRCASQRLHWPTQPQA